MQTQGKPPSVRIAEDRIAELEAEVKRLRDAISRISIVHPEDEFGFDAAWSRMMLIAEDAIRKTPSL